MLTIQLLSGLLLSSVLFCTLVGTWRGIGVVPVGAMLPLEVGPTVVAESRARPGTAVVPGTSPRLAGSGYEDRRLPYGPPRDNVGTAGTFWLCR